MAGKRAKVYEYDLLVVGAGPAGLSAARTAARLGFKTLVVERQPRSTSLGHESSAVLLPTGDLIPGEMTGQGLHFSQVDLLVPRSMILDPETTVCCVSPFAYEFQPYSDYEPPTTIVNRPALLRLLVDQARNWGTHFAFGTEVTGLLRTGHQVTGVQTSDGEIRARLVLSAEGVSRRLCGEAGLWGKAEPATQRTLVTVREDREGCLVQRRELGQVVLMGRCFTGGHAGWTALLTPLPGKAEISFTTMIDRLEGDDLTATCATLEACLHNSRVAEFVREGHATPRPPSIVAVREPPASVAANGFMAAGDAVTPLGHLGILPAMYLGRQAALVAAEALDNGLATASALSPYDRLWKSRIRPGLEAQARAVIAMLNMTDDEVERLCETLAFLRLPIPFVSNLLRADWQAVRLLERQFPMVLRDWQLLDQMLAGAPGDRRNGAELGPAAIPASAPVRPA